MMMIEEQTPVEPETKEETGEEHSSTSFTGKKASPLAMITALSGLAGNVWPFTRGGERSSWPITPVRRYREPTPKPKVVCSLPTCDVLTEHNGGYCCASHCREHRNMLRQKGKHSISCT